MFPILQSVDPSSDAASTGRSCVQFGTSTVRLYTGKLVAAATRRQGIYNDGLENSYLRVL